MNTSIAKKYLKEYREYRKFGYCISLARSLAVENSFLDIFTLISHLEKYNHFWKDKVKRYNYTYR